MDGISLFTGALAWITAIIGGFGLGRRIERAGYLFLVVSAALAVLTVVQA